MDNNSLLTFLNVIFSTLTLALLYPIFTTDNSIQTIEVETLQAKTVYRPRRNNYLRTTIYLLISFITTIAIAFGDDDVVIYAISFLLALLLLAIAIVCKTSKLAVNT
ncbi:MAG: hypothetical protein H7Z73_12600 [Candidatus Saccharibacteria bacterium]|nr:hypothetical protein [Moraxellaceae bacterium]